MKALYYDGLLKKASYTEEYKKPSLNAGESLIRIEMAAVCNTDKEILKGYKPSFSGIMGHEFVGVVEESDNKELVGKRVVGELNEGCGTCLYCKTGREHHCDNRKVIGITARDGAFCEYMTMATRLLHVVPDSLSTSAAIYTEPLAAALRIPQLCHLSPDKNAAIIGDGRLGFMIAQVLSLQGIDLTVIGHSAEKLKAFAPFAKTLLQPEGSYEVVIDASGGASGLATAKSIVRREGTIIIKSTYAGEATVDMSYFVVNEVKLVGSRCGPFAPALRLLEQGKIKLPEIKLYPLSEWENAFADRESFKTGFIF